MRVLITGANGQLARYVVQELEGKHDLVLFSRSRPPEDRAHLPWVQGDLNDFVDCRRAVEGIDAIQHLGAVPYPVDHPQIQADAAAEGRAMPLFDATLHTNIMGTFYLMKAAVAAGVKTVVMSGSACAFGHGYRISQRPFPFKYIPVDEDHPSDVEDSYSFSKLAGEELLASFTRAYGVRTYITRPPGICSPESRRAMAENARPATVWNDYLWAWVASEDVARMHRMIMELTETLPPHDVYYLNGADTSALEPTRELIERFHPDLLPLVRDLPGHASFFSGAKARQVFGFEPRFTWRK